MAIYTLSAAALMPVLGRLADLVGKMKVDFAGLAAFGLGALLVTLAQGVALLMIGRLGQGLGAACLVSTSLAVLSAATPEKHRPFVLGLWGAMIALGMSLGPIIAGLLTEYLSWRMIFVSDLALVCISAALAIPVMRAGYVPYARDSGVRLDYAGAATLMLLLGPLAYALTHGQDHGWSNPVTLAVLTTAVVAGIAFFLIERHKDEPLIHLGYFRQPGFLMANLGMLLVGIFLMGVLTYFNLFVQSPDTLAFSPVYAGAAVLPLTCVMFALSVSAPRLLAPYGARWPVTIGMIAFAVGCFLLADTSNDSTYDGLWWKLSICGVGFGLTMPLLPHAGLRLLPDRHVGQGSGMINTCLYFGASLGVVLGGIVSALAIRANIGAVLATLPVNSSRREALVSTLAHGSSDEIEHALAALDDTTGAALRTALRGVHDDAFDHTMLALAVVGVVGAVLAAWLLRNPRSGS
jgi:MFS family permease